MEKKSISIGMKAQFPDLKIKFAKRNLRRQVSSANSENVRVYLETKSTHSFKSISKQLGIKEEL